MGRDGERAVPVNAKTAMLHCPTAIQHKRRARAARAARRAAEQPEACFGGRALRCLFREAAQIEPVSLLEGLFGGYAQAADGGDELITPMTAMDKVERRCRVPLSCVVVANERRSHLKYLRLEEEGEARRKQRAKERATRHLDGRVAWRREKIRADVAARLLGVARTSAATLMAKRTAEQSYAALFKCEKLRQRCTLESVLLEVLELAIKPSEGEMHLVRPLTAVEYAATKMHYGATRNDTKYVWQTVGARKQAESLPPLPRNERDLDALWVEAKWRTKKEFEERLRGKILGTLLHSCSKTLARAVYSGTWRRSHVGIVPRSLAVQ